MISTLSCGCMYSHPRKCFVKYCRMHLNNVISANLQREKQMQEQIIQQQNLQKQKSNGFRVIPLFKKNNKKFKPLF
jgi:hypothetical protein